MIYFNNAATTFPKPLSVIEAVKTTLEKQPFEPGRTGTGEDISDKCRQLTGTVFGVGDSSRVILTPSATYSLNMAIHGCLRGKGGHVVSSILEHNSVLRPLAHWCREYSGQLDLLEPEASGAISADHVRTCIRNDTRLIIISHASNVTGWIQPVEKIANIASAAGIPLLIDASQSAGAVSLHMDSLPGRVFAAAAGHKGLYGPAGVGVLIVPDMEMLPWIQGGTGIRSESEYQPQSLPLYYESGTPNLPGIAGLCAGLEFVLNRGIDTLSRQRKDLVAYLKNCLADIQNLRMIPAADTDGATGIVSLAVDGMNPESVGYALREVFDIEVRTGLHCAPLIHHILRTAPGGTLRVSFGAFNTFDEIDIFSEAVHSLLSHDTRYRNAAVRKLLGSIPQPGMETRRSVDGTDHEANGGGSETQLLPAIPQTLFPH